jgi:diguanylate cyclase (GGDEF)-like protein
MADGLAMFDHEGRIIMCNPQYSRLFPKTADIRVAGATLEEILRAGIARGEERPPPLTRVEDWIADTVAALWISADSEFQLGDGRWLQARVRPSDDGTSLTVISEITAAKKAEKALHELNIQLDALARTDGLTDLLNRRALDEALAREFVRSVRTGRPLSLFIADVDCFKIYNDTYGHPEGDACLKAVGGCLAETLKRPTDVGARYGGEEFVALLPDTDANGALVIAESFRQAVRELNIAHSGTDKGRVTVTVGVATSGRTAIDSPAILLQTADEALYAGKTAGRDRTVQTAPTEDGRIRLIAG